MEHLFEIMERLLTLTGMRIVRDYMSRIKWDKRLIAIRGARGVGKTTLMLQYIKLNYGLGNRKVLYCSLEDLYFNTNTLISLAEKFYQQGGEVLMFDEVHKYPGWSREVKEIYDTLPQLRVVISGSSILNIINADADLSRRCRPYDMKGLSFREFLKFYHDIAFPACTLEEIIENASEICAEVNMKCRPIAMFREYLKVGYYPFYDGDIEDYYLQLTNIVNYIITQELPSLCGVDSAYARKIKALISIIATTVPFEIDITKLSRTIEVARTTLLDYLQKLQRAELLTLLYSDVMSVKKMQKPDKVYLQNPNLLAAFALHRPDIGTLRETFAIMHLLEAGEVEYGKKVGDFMVDRKYTFEVGGSDKDFSQIAGIPHSYVLADDVEYSTGNKLPLWLTGFLY